MTNLTHSEARRLIDKLHHNQTKEHGISILEEKYLAALEIALPVLEQQEAKNQVSLREGVEAIRNIVAGSGGYNFEALRAEQEQPEGQFFLVEHDSGYEVETTLHAAIQRQADFGGCIWALTGSILKPQTDTYRQIENDGWIELGEGAIPVHPESLVEIKMRNGATDGPRKATGFLWYRGNAVRDEMDCDIIAYRVIENDGREG